MELLAIEYGWIEPDTSQLNYLEVQEIISRKTSLIQPLQLNLFDNVTISAEALPQAWIVAELLYYLEEWYATDAQRRDCLSDFERSLATAAKLCSVWPSSPPHFPVSELLRVAQDRYYESWRQEQL